MSLLEFVKLFELCIFFIEIRLYPHLSTAVSRSAVGGNDELGFNKSSDSRNIVFRDDDALRQLKFVYPLALSDS